MAAPRRAARSLPRPVEPIPTDAGADQGGLLGALEELLHDIERLDAIAAMASRAVEEMPRPSGGDEERRAANRLYAVVSLMADEAEAAATAGREVVERCTTERRAAREARS